MRALQTSPDAVKVKAVEAVFTRTEARELELRLDLERDGEVLQNFFAVHPDLQGSFGGIYVDHNAGGKLILQLVRNHSRVNEIPGMLPPLRHKERLQINLVEWSNTRLKQQFNAISDVIEHYPSILMVAIKESTNQVVVTIDPAITGSTGSVLVAKDTLPDDLASLLADPSIVVWSGTIGAQETAVMAGQGYSIAFSGGTHFCTLAFEVVYQNAPAMLTAGHCVKDSPSGTRVYVGSTDIGYYRGEYQFGSNIDSGIGVDVGIIRTNNASTATDDIYQGTVSSLDIVGATNSYNVGNARCFRGNSGGTVCTTITFSSITFTDNGRYLRDMFALDTIALQGDSGAPVYQQSNTTAYATGILYGNISGGPVAGTDSAHSKWQNAATWFNLTLVTTD